MSPKEELTIAKVEDVLKLVPHDSEDEEAKTKELVDNLLSVIQNESQENILNNDLYTIINLQLERLQAIINDALDSILHHPEFIEMEGKWLGFKYLIDNSELDAMMKVKLLTVTKKELEDDFNKAIDFDQTYLYKKVYTAEYDTYGGKLVTYMLMDEHITSSASDCKFLSKTAEVCAAAHAPIFIGGSPKLVNLTTWQELHKIRDLVKVMESPSKVQWNALRDKEDSKYLGIVIPDLLARNPYHPENNPCEDLNYIETCDPYNENEAVWINGIYAMGQVINRSYKISGWPIGICGVEGGGIVEDLNVYTYYSHNGDMLLKCPLKTNRPINDTMEYQLSMLGLTAICSCKDSNKAVFFSSSNMYRRKKYNSIAATSSSAKATQMPGVLTVSRVSHCLKTVMRNAIGSFKTKEDIQTMLQNVIAQHVLLNDSAGQELKAMYPLKGAHIEVVDQPGIPGAYGVSIRLCFHEQFNTADTTLYMVTELPGS